MPAHAQESETYRLRKGLVRAEARAVGLCFGSRRSRSRRTACTMQHTCCVCVCACASVCTGMQYCCLYAAQQQPCPSIRQSRKPGQRREAVACQRLTADRIRSTYPTRWSPPVVAFTPLRLPYPPLCVRDFTYTFETLIKIQPGISASLGLGKTEQE